MAKAIDELANLIAADLRAGRQTQVNPKAAIAALPLDYRQELTEIAYLKAARLANSTVRHERLEEVAAAKGFTNVVKAMFPEAVIMVFGNRIIIEVK